MRPILLIPGIGGSILIDRKHTHKQFLHWRLLDNRWLNLYPYSKSAVKRWKNDMGYDIKRDSINNEIIGFDNYINNNIKVHDFGGTMGIKDVVSEFSLLSLEHQRNLENQYHFRYFHALCEYFYKKGYDDHKSLFGLPYDFRLVLDPTYRTVIFTAFKKQIENAVLKNNNQAAVIVTHSFGGIMLKWLLHTLNDDEWIQKYISQWVCISCPFGGSAFALRSATSGDYYLPMFHKTFKEELNKNSAMIACLPNELAYEKDKPLIIVDNMKEITISDYHDLALKDNFIAFEIYKDLYQPQFEILKGHLPINTHIIRTDQLDTPERYYTKTLLDYAYKTEYAGGDGVVLNDSLLAYRKVLKPDMTRDTVIPFSDHTALISNTRVLRLIEHYALR